MTSPHSSQMCLALCADSPVADQRCADKLDLVFVLDSSESITRKNPGNWQKVLDFVVRIVDYYTIGEEDTRVGVVLFSDKGYISFNLTAYRNKQSLELAIKRLRHIKSYTDTFDGLNKMRTLFSEEYGDRPEVPNVAIVFTDGQHTPGTKDPVDEARRAHAEGITVLAVGVNEAVEEEIRGISSPPQEENQTYWLRPEFDDLTSIINDLQQTTCGSSGDACTLGMGIHQLK